MAPKTGEKVWITSWEVNVQNAISSTANSTSVWFAFLVLTKEQKYEKTVFHCYVYSFVSFDSSNIADLLQFFDIFVFLPQLCIRYYLFPIWFAFVISRYMQMQQMSSFNVLDSLIKLLRSSLSVSFKVIKNRWKSFKFTWQTIIQKNEYGEKINQIFHFSRYCRGCSVWFFYWS